MKKLFCLVLLVCMTASFACAEIPPLTNTVLKYNSVASTFGAGKIDESTLIVEGNTNVYQIGNCLVGFVLDENGTVTNGAVLALDDSDDGNFLRSCMVMVTFLGEMDYSAYGHILHQYAEIKGGKEKGVFCLLGLDTFNMTAEKAGPMLLYNNNDMETWY